VKPIPKTMEAAREVRLRRFSLPPVCISVRLTLVRVRKLGRSISTSSTLLKRMSDLYQRSGHTRSWKSIRMRMGCISPLKRRIRVLLGRSSFGCWRIADEERGDYNGAERLEERVFDDHEEEEEEEEEEG
jgi:hypothetical protein